MSAPKAARTRANMADVARLASVSTQTVSRFFTGTGYVGEETRERISAAVDQLGYRPNQSARNLRTQRANAIGVLSMGAMNYGAGEVLAGLSRAAREAGFTLSTSQLDVDPHSVGWEEEARRTLEHFLSIPVAGIIIPTLVLGVSGVLDELSDMAPAVLAFERERSTESAVPTHSYAAGLRATQHLLDLGHTAIVHVAGPMTRNDAVERRRGYEDAMAAAGVPASVIDEADAWSPASGYRAGEAVDPDTFTAVFTSNDDLALGFMSAMAHRGRHAPADYSIIGVDDMPAAAYLSPPLTTMRIDFQSLGATMFRMLHHEIVTGEHGEPIPPNAQLIERESTAPHGTAAPSAR